MKVTRLLISIEGQWSSGPNRDWRGWATATEPLVAITFLSTPTDCNWSRSARAEMPCEVRLTLGRFDKQGREVQVNFSVAGGYQIGRSRVPSPSYQPDILSQHQFSTGVIQTFAKVEGEPDMELLVLFLARQDVRWGRCRLWRLRRELAESITNDSMRALMTYGRTGHLLNGNA
jgi:hypothetical protein